MRPFARFLALEAVSWVIGGLILLALVQAELIAPWLAWVLLALLVVKDFALYPWTRRAYEDGVEHGAEDLLGAEVEVDVALDPEGYVRAGRERWRARLEPGSSGALQPGDRARVEALEGLTLVVTPLL